MVYLQLWQIVMVQIQITRKKYHWLAGGWWLTHADLVWEVFLGDKPGDAFSS
jgi:hypothetical protein